MSSEKENKIEKCVDEVESVLKEYFGNRLEFTYNFKVSVKRFLMDLDIDELKYFMDISCRKMDDPNDATRYFCGMCWTTIKGMGAFLC